MRCLWRDRNTFLALTMDSLLESIRQVIDDTDCLNQMRETSLEICEVSFHWSDFGTSLCDRIEMVRDEVVGECREFRGWACLAGEAELDLGLIFG